MNGPRLAMVLAGALAALAGCESGLPGRDPLHVNAMSGAKVGLTGTSWELCTDAAAGSQRYREIHGEEGAITFVLATYGAPGCTGTATVSDTFAVYGEARGDAPVTWSGTAPAGVPDPPPPATKVRLQAPGGGATGDVYLVDDRDPAHRVLYTGDPRAPRDSSGYATKLYTDPEVEQP